jgi:hypothetical protein
MKRRTIFIVLSLLVLIFFACDLKIPSKIVIKGTPSIEFAETVDIGKIFSDLLNDAINEDKAEGMDIVPCTNTELEYITFVIHMDLFDRPLTIEEDAPDISEYPGFDLGDYYDKLADGETITLTEDKDLINSGEPMILPLSSIGSYLTDFNFKDLKTKLYFSGSETIEKLEIKLAKVEVDKDNTDPLTEPDPEFYETITSPINQSSGFNGWKNSYNEKTLPNGGSEFALPMNGKDIAIFFKVIVPKGTELERKDFEDGTIKVEIVVWLPFVFESINNNAEIAFPEDSLFSSKDDLFGRKSADADNTMTDIVESLSLEIEINKDVFKGADLIVWSKKTDGSEGIVITNKITENSLPFIIEEADMKKINDPVNWPFTPNFKLRFPLAGDTISFPKEFNTTNIIFTANIKYKMDL